MESSVKNTYYGVNYNNIIFVPNFFGESSPLQANWTINTHTSLQPMIADAEKIAWIVSKKWACRDRETTGVFVILALSMY